MSNYIVVCVLSVLFAVYTLCNMRTLYCTRLTTNALFWLERWNIHRNKPSWYVHTHAGMLYVLAFTSFSWGQPPARQTKVVESDLCPLKSGLTCLYVLFCAMILQQAQGLLLWEGLQLMLMHKLILWRTVQCAFVTVLYVARLVNIHIQMWHFAELRECYNVISSNSSTSCATENIVYIFIKCGVLSLGLLCRVYICTLCGLCLYVSMDTWMCGESRYCIRSSTHHPISQGWASIVSCSLCFCCLYRVIVENINWDVFVAFTSFLH